MTDIINEYYGKRGVKMLSYIGVGMISYAFFMIYGAIHLVPAATCDHLQPFLLGANACIQHAGTSALAGA